jgi:competence protein ComEC
LAVPYVSHSYLWIVFSVALGGGILFYFHLQAEPTLFEMGALVSLAGLFFLTRCLIPPLKITLPFWLLCAVGGFVMGLGASFYRTQNLDTPLLSAPFLCRSLKGRVLSVAPLPRTPTTASRVRLIMDQLEASPSLPAPLHRIRLSLPSPKMDFEPGDRVRVRVQLLPLPDAPSPFSRNFRRQDFFKQIGANGFARSPPHLVAREGKGGWALAINRVRHQMTLRLLRHLPPPVGALAAALVTGDTTALPADVRTAFSQAGMAHILAISGLHLAIVAGFVFLLIQRVLALVPYVALRYPLHKIAACLAIKLTFFYLLLSGAGVPAQRSFVMTSMMMVAIMVDRPAVSIRLWAMAASVILIATPEVLLGASFPLSFSAVLMLIVSYDRWSQFKRTQEGVSKAPSSLLVKGLSYGLGCALSSFLASVATAPFAAVFFHQLSLQSIAANVLAIPLVTFVIMPLATAVCFGFYLGFWHWLMPAFHASLQGLLKIADTVSSWPGAALSVPLGAPWGLSVFVLGGLCVCLTPFPRRVPGGRSWIGLGGGFVLMVLGFGGILTPHVPTFWMDAESRVMGFFDADSKTLWVSSLRRASFVQKFWMEATGARRRHKMPSSWCGKGRFGLSFCMTTTGVLPASSEPFDVILSLRPLAQRDALKAGCVVDPLTLRDQGACVVWETAKPPGFEQVYSRKGRGRPWDPSSSPALIPALKGPGQSFGR